MFYTCNYNIRIAHRNELLLSIFFTNQIHGGIISRLFFIHFVAPCAYLHLAVKILLQIFLYEDLSTLMYPYICQLYFPPECQQDRTLLRSNTISENIPNIWHKSSQNTRRSGQIETMKTIMQTTRPRITWKVLPMAQVAIFKEIFDKVRKDLDCELFILN